MINVAKLITGEYVEATSNISDFAVPGTIFKIVWNRIPGDEQKALGWKISAKTGAVEGSESFPLPHDKIEYLNRKALAKLLKATLPDLEKKKSKVDKEIRLLESRIDALEETESSDQESELFLKKAFNFI